MRLIVLPFLNRPKLIFTISKRTRNKADFVPNFTHL